MSVIKRIKLESGPSDQDLDIDVESSNPSKEEEEEDLFIECDDGSYSAVKLVIKEEPNEESPISLKRISNVSENQDCFGVTNSSELLNRLLRVKKRYNESICKVSDSDLSNESLNVFYDKENDSGEPTVLPTRNTDEMSYVTMETEETSSEQPMYCVSGSTDWPGIYNFTANIQDHSEKKRNCEYSEKLNKLYATMNSNLPVHFKWDQKESGLHVRGTVKYVLSNDMHLPVRRCPNHAQPACSTNAGFPYVYHVLRCVESGSVYKEDPKTGHLSVITPLGIPEPGSEVVTLLYRFMCLTSCLAGMNRRPVQVVFTLERPNGEVLGRRSMHVKVCSCISRDKAKDENKITSPVIYKRKVATTTQEEKSEVTATQDQNLNSLPNSTDNSVHLIKIVGLARYRYCAAILHDIILGESIRKHKQLSSQELDMLDDLKKAANGTR